MSHYPQTPSPSGRLAAEQHMQPITRFNDVVGPLFNEIKGRFPLDDEHTDSGLARSLGVFLEQCFVKAAAAMQLARPEAMTNEQWQASSEEDKQPHLHWQANFRYLKQRRQHYIDMMGFRKNDRLRAEKEENWLD